VVYVKKTLLNVNAEMYERRLVFFAEVRAAPIVAMVFLKTG
jgi:hypothetical protein